MSVRTPSLLGVCASLLLTAASAQEAKHTAYPGRDILSPFRSPTDVYAPPDEVYRLLRKMQAAADRPGAIRSHDRDGREVIDAPAWREAKVELDKVGVDAGYLAQIMRLHRNGTERATAYYGAFYVHDTDHVFNLISHIPGEPLRSTREAAMQRAIPFLRANLNRRFSDLSPERRQAILQAMPEPGSPAAKARGIERLPSDQDHLHTLLLTPFFQLLDLDDTLDQAQGLWFLKEVFTARRDLAVLWLEPSLPRVRQLLLSPAKPVAAEAIGLIEAIGPKDLRPAPEDQRELIEWADVAIKSMFPPIRSLNGAIVQIYPSPERDALAAAGVKSLETAAIGDAFSGKRKDGTSFRGCRITLVPDELRALAIPRGAVITTINGVGVNDARSLLQVVREQVQVQQHPRQLLVEYVLDGDPHAIEYRLM